MKSGLAVILVTATAFFALPAAAQEATAQRAAPSAEDLPLTDNFANLLTSYRNCVLKHVDRSDLGITQQDMAKNAMSACALARGELRSQLLEDIKNIRPQMASALIMRDADNGLEQVDPMIEAAAVDRAHARYARAML
ncbi:MAG: hypothetical protein J7494_08705 [Sphingobium sp.]|nr:hypothetical protein [Sphingobium sp.]